MTERHKLWNFKLIEELDALLVWFSDKKGLEYSFEELYTELKTSRYSEYLLTKDIAGIIRVCLQTLVNDGYVTEIPRKEHNLNLNHVEIINRYGISFQGLLFLETTGSYKNKIYGEDIENKHRKSELTRNKHLFWLTVCIAIYTASQGFFNGLETVRNYYNQFLPLTKIYIIPFCFWMFLIYIVIISLSEIKINTKRKKQ